MWFQFRQRITGNDDLTRSCHPKVLIRALVGAVGLLVQIARRCPLAASSFIAASASRHRFVGFRGRFGIEHHESGEPFGKFLRYECTSCLQRLL